MKYSFIADTKLRNIMISANKKRIFSASSIKISKSKNSLRKVQVISPEKRRKHQSKVYALQTYMQESKQRSKIKAEGKMGALRGDGQKLKKPKKMKNKKLKSPPTKDLAVTTKQLSSMIKTGLPLLDALNIISETAENVTIKYVFKETSLGISKGLSMSENLEKYPEVFNEMYLALVTAGETAGLLPDTLEREAKLLESLAKIKGQIKSAMAYPIAIFTLTIVVVIAMLIFVIPIFVDIYEQSNAKLPAITQLLVDASNQLVSLDFYIKAIPTVFILFQAYKYFSRRPSVLWWFDRTMLFLPVVKDLVTKSCLANFSRTLSALNTAGVPILEALSISRKTISNRIFKKIIDNMYQDIQSGNPIYKVLEKEIIIPVMFTSMFRIGEETGELSQMINKLADFYEEEVTASVKTLTSIMEPLLIVFVAVIVAVILIAMYLPMFSMMDTVG